MRISIVTPSFNHGEFIEQTIRSVMNQDHDDIEHIVVDGGSRDGTISILKKYPHLQWTSEGDSGQAQAINKGFRRASGDILAWLNSDDFYEPNILGEVVRCFQSDPSCMLLYGDITYVDRQGSVLLRITGETINHSSLIEQPDIIRQPSFFWRREVVDKVGVLDENLHLVMDYDFFLRVAERFPFRYCNKNFSYYRTYPENKTRAMLGRQAIELFAVFKKHHIPLTYRRARYLLVKLADSIGIGNVLRSALGPLRKTTKG